LKVYLDKNGEKILIGRADVPEGLPFFDVELFGSSSMITDRFTIGSVTHLHAGQPPFVETAVIVLPGQYAEILPGWQPLSA
jgi:hypothetical protein